jgi:CRISPR-associated protein Cst1
MNNSFELYPSNWLYNAGVVGFLSCLDREDYLDNYKAKRYIIEDGQVKIQRDVFEMIKVEENYFKNGKIVNLIGKNNYYPNFLASAGTQNELFEKYVKLLSSDAIKNTCDFCGEGHYIKLNDNDKIKGFLFKVESFDRYHNINLGPSEKFPNAYWNNCTKMKICHLCTFILIHHHLSLTKLSDGSEIFINAPSFKLMYELNKLVKEIFGKGELNPKEKREILAMSLIEYARRIQTTLGMWSAMNIEIITKQGDLIDYYTIPYDIVNLISDRTIAFLLSDLGEFSILNYVLDGSYNQLTKVAYDLLRISLKPVNERNKAEKAIINKYLKRDKNKNNLSVVTYKILRLYANIIDRRKTYARTK